MTMNPEIKTLWVEALRSGKYKQGDGKLRKIGTDTGEDLHCCLGVLCDLAVDAGVVQRYLDDDDIYVYYTPAGNKSREFLPTAVQTWAGFRYGDNSPTIAPIGESLVGLNDNGKPFTLIANVIEEYL